MKTILLLLTMLSLVPATLRAEESLADKLRRAAEKAAEKAGVALDKVETKGRQWWNDAKESVKMKRPDYEKRAGDALDTYAAEIKVLKESASGVAGRDYFKTRLLALEQHLAFAQDEFETIRATPSEAEFRARQRKFDRTMWALDGALGQALEEAGE
ncbi:MAG: hypothetical protein KDK97_05985 [Verrucomicrobiales bacterium]|nr:hypothetical protein [Verrucomicrobiales bacterium]MCP5559609.1 hypothetical protein [Verrucomicrobiaceae bacterium]